jgi:hypothetical protein
VKRKRGELLTLLESLWIQEQSRIHETKKESQNHSYCKKEPEDVGVEIQLSVAVEGAFYVKTVGSAVKKKWVEGPENGN